MMVLKNDGKIGHSETWDCSAEWGVKYGNIYAGSYATFILHCQTYCFRMHEDRGPER
jgi:hypothetical protein